MFGHTNLHALLKSVSPLSDITFTLDNQFTRTFAADEVVSNYPRQVQSAYSFVEPKNTKNPQLVAISKHVVKQIGLTEQQVNSAEFLQLF